MTKEVKKECRLVVIIKIQMGRNKEGGGIRSPLCAINYCYSYQQKLLTFLSELTHKRNCNILG